jgi:hypothetical protein
VYSDFYEIPLPALRFEKVEENSRKSERNRRERRLLNSTTSEVTDQRQKGRHTTLIDSKETLKQSQVNNTEERNNDFLINTRKRKNDVREKRRSSIKPGKDHSIKKTPKKSHSRNDASNTENNTQGTLTLPETKLRQ